MANETELERLVVRLIGDTQHYMDSMKEAAEATQHAAHQIEDHTHAIGVAHITLGELVAHQIEHTVEKLKEMAQETLHAYMTHEVIHTKLHAILSANGRDVEALTEDYEAFAKQLGSTTTAGKGTILGLIQEAETMGLTGEAAKEAAKNVLALRAAGMPSSMRLVARLGQGQAGRMAMMFGINTQGMSEQEKVAAVMEKVHKARKLAEAELETLEGQTKKYEQALHGLEASYGQFMANAMRPYLEAKKEAVIWLRNVDDETKKAIFTAGSLFVGYVALSGGIQIAGAALAAYVTKAQLATVWTASLKTALIGAGIALAAYIAIKAVQDSEGAKQEKEALEEELKIRAKATNEINEQTQSLLELAKAKGGGEQDFLEETLKETEHRIAKTSESIKAMKEELEELQNPGFFSADKARRGIIGQMLFGDPDANKKAVLETTKEIQEALERQAEALKGRAKKFGPEGGLPTHDIEEFNKKLDEEIALHGLKGTALEIEKKKLLGANDAQMAYAKSIANVPEMQAFQDEMRDLNEELDTQRATLDMTEAEAKAYGLALKAAKIEGADFNDELGDLTDKLKTQELFKQGKQLRDQFMDPLEKFTKKKKDLDEMLKVGALGEGAKGIEIYNQALEEAQKQLENVTDAANKMRDAAGGGSVEALSRLQEQISGGGFSDRFRPQSSSGFDSKTGSQDSPQFDKLLDKLAELVVIGNKQLVKPLINFGNAELN